METQSPCPSPSCPPVAESSALWRGSPLPPHRGQQPGSFEASGDREVAGHTQWPGAHGPWTHVTCPARSRVLLGVPGHCRWPPRVPCAVGVVMLPVSPRGGTVNTPGLLGTVHRSSSRDVNHLGSGPVDMQVCRPRLISAATLGGS